MLSSATTDGECNCSCCRKGLNGGSSSSSKLSSSTTSTSFSYLYQAPRSNKATEEVWKDINLASLNDHSTGPMTTNVQDFLSRPFTFTISVDPPTSNSLVSSASKTSSLHCPATASLAPPPATALSLSSRPEFPFDPLRHKDLLVLQPHNNPASKVNPFSNPFQSLASTSNSWASSGKKRFLESYSSSGDRRNKRMMKNRESAARSRARKQEMIASFHHS